MEFEDWKQEYKLLKFINPDEADINIRRDLCDISRSRAYSHSWGNKFDHIWIDGLAGTSFYDELMPKYRIDDEVVENADIDIILAFLDNVLARRDIEILNMVYTGYKVREIAQKLSLDRSSVSKRLSSIRKLVRERFGGYYVQVSDSTEG